MRESPPRNNSPRWKRESRVCDQLPQASRALATGFTLVSFHAEISRPEMCRDSWEQGKGAKAANISPTARETVVPSDLLCRGPQQLSLLKKPTDSLQIYWLPPHRYLCLLKSAAESLPVLYLSPQPPVLQSLASVPAVSFSLCVAHVDNDSLDPHG